jgi:hypothetical protein
MPYVHVGEPGVESCDCRKAVRHGSIVKVFHRFERLVVAVHQAADMMLLALLDLVDFIDSLELVVLERIE